VLAVGAGLSGVAEASAQVPSTQDDNLTFIRAHHDRWAQGAADAVIADFAEDFVNFGRPVGRAGIALTVRDIFATFPDWRMDIEDTLAAQDQVVVRCRVSGTHRGIGQRPINGGMLVGLAPTGRAFSTQHIHWYTVRNHQIIAHRATRDDIGMLRQLGVLPPAPVAAPPPP
jgi:predicted ester cyclase